MEPNTPSGVKLFLGLVFAVVAVILISVIFPFYTVDAGERAVVLNFGAFNGEVAGEGLHFRVPFKQSVVKMDVKVQKEEAVVGAASKDLQTVNAKVAVNYHPTPEKVGVIYQTIGLDYKVRVIQPAIQEAVKSATAKFTAEELITKRESVKEDIKTNVRTRLAESNILVDELNITDFDFSKSFNEAIEAKVTAEQNALASKNKLDQVKYEAQQAVETAKGKAEAISIESAALQNSPQLIELRKIEKWDGKLPTYSGSATPFIDVTK